MVEPAQHRFSILVRCCLLRISRLSYYYAQVPETNETLALMTVIGETLMECPWCGSRQMARRIRDRSLSGTAVDGENGPDTDPSKPRR